jgi:hypothetical protein
MTICDACDSREDVHWTMVMTYTGDDEGRLAVYQDGRANDLCQVCFRGVADYLNGQVSA